MKAERKKSEIVGGVDIIDRLLSGGDSQFSVFNDKIERLRHGHSSSSFGSRHEIPNTNKTISKFGQKHRFVLSAKNQFTKQQ